MSTAPLWTSGAMAAAMQAASRGLLPEAVIGLSIDSRSIAPGEAYFAIKGDVHDGHDFVAAALQAGAALRWSKPRSATGSQPMRRCWWWRTCWPAWSRSPMPRARA